MGVMCSLNGWRAGVENWCGNLHFSLGWLAWRYLLLEPGVCDSVWEEHLGGRVNSCALQCHLGTLENEEQLTSRCLASANSVYSIPAFPKVDNLEVIQWITVPEDSILGEGLSRRCFTLLWTISRIWWIGAQENPTNGVCLRAYISYTRELGLASSFCRHSPDGPWGRGGGVVWRSRNNSWPGLSASRKSIQDLREASD